MYRRRYSRNEEKGCGKLLNFDRDLFVTDPDGLTLTKDDLIYNHDYLILRGNFSGRIARFVGKEYIKRYGSFKSSRNNELRVKCDHDGFACVPHISCWKESIKNDQRDYKRPPIIVFKANSVVGDIPTEYMHFAIKNDKNLIELFTAKNDIIPEVININYIEKILIKLGNHSSAHKALKQIMEYGFYAVYEDDGWLMKANSGTKIRFMRRSHLFSLTICYSCKDVMNAIFDDFTLRSLLPVRLFAGIIGKRKKQKPGHFRRSSSMDFGNNPIDLNEILSEYDKSESYARIMRREGAVDGNLLCLDTPNLDCARSFIEHGGYAKDIIVPNIVKYRKMIKNSSAGDEPYLLMSEIKIANTQWSELVKYALPNNKFKKYSFSLIYYDGTTKISSPKIAHKIIHPIKPKNDIELVFKKKLLMNNSYLIVALSSRGIKDDKIPFVFDNVESYVQKIAFKMGYIARKVSMGIHKNKMLYCDFQIFVRTILNDKQRKIFKLKMKKKLSNNNGESKDDNTYSDFEDEYDESNTNNSNSNSNNDSLSDDDYKDNNESKHKIKDSGPDFLQNLDEFTDEIYG